MERIAAWLARHAQDVHFSLLPPPSPEKIRWAMKQLGADASPALETWLRMTGGQEWANAPDAALPPYLLFSTDEIVWNTQDLRADGTLPPRAAAVIGHDFDDDERYLLLDSAGLLWGLDGGRIEKVAGSVEELITRVLANRPQLRGWLPGGHQTMGTARLAVAFGAAALISVVALALAARTEGLPALGWSGLGVLLIGLLARAVWNVFESRAWSRALVKDLKSTPAEPWKANEYWRRGEAFPLKSNAPKVQLADVPIHVGAAVIATVEVPDAEARLECVQILTGTLHGFTDPFEEHSCECRHEKDRAVLTILVPDTWPTRLPGHYPNRAIVWQLTLLANGREYRYWLPVFD